MSKISRGDMIQIVQNSKQKSIWSGIFTLVALIVLLAGAVGPTIATITRIVTEVEQKKVINRQLNEKISAMTSLKQQYNNTVKDILEDVSLVYPDRGDFSLILVNIEEICKMNGFSLSSISFDSPDLLDTEMTLTAIAPWNVSLVVVGDRSNLVPLLSDLESMPSYSVIDGLSFGRSANESSEASFTIILRIYKIIDPNFY